jgi:hypothetical protein
METNYLTKIKTALKHFMVYVFFALSLVVGFSLGYIYKSFISYKSVSETESRMIYKKNVDIAIDENDNLLVISKKDGSYTLYEDSIGYTIFNFYAKNIWNYHSKNQSEPSNNKSNGNQNIKNN